mmetsp:Transcript_86466/g.259426  ORF Transcript_86466/g.259426 Transcript_86466/m.259426 type:complete len:338 (+) Transcript_86466:1001-2014(+)
MMSSTCTTTFGSVTMRRASLPMMGFVLPFFGFVSLSLRLMPAFQSTRFTARACASVQLWHSIVVPNRYAQPLVMLCSADSARLMNSMGSTGIAPRIAPLCDFEWMRRSVLRAFSSPAFAISRASRSTSSSVIVSPQCMQTGSGWSGNFSLKPGSLNGFRWLATVWYATVRLAARLHFAACIQSDFSSRQRLQQPSRITGVSCALIACALAMSPPPLSSHGTGSPSMSSVIVTSVSKPSSSRIDSSLAAVLVTSAGSSTSGAMARCRTSTPAHARACNDCSPPILAASTSHAWSSSPISVIRSAAYLTELWSRIVSGVRAIQRVRGLPFWNPILSQST